jgi:hypothetical protein
MKKVGETIEVGRLTLRVEGSHWVARYEVQPGTDLYLGQIAMRLVTEGRCGQQRREQFIRLMSDCTNDIIESVLGSRPVMGHPKPAPESERSGNA